MKILLLLMLLVACGDEHNFTSETPATAEKVEQTETLSTETEQTCEEPLPAPPVPIPKPTRPPFNPNTHEYLLEFYCPALPSHQRGSSDRPWVGYLTIDDMIANYNDEQQEQHSVKADVCKFLNYYPQYRNHFPAELQFDFCKDVTAGLICNSPKHYQQEVDDGS